MIPSILDHAGIDPTGSSDSAAGIKAAHDAVAASGGRYLEFPAGMYLAPALDQVGDVIFVGEGVLTGGCRKRVVPRFAGPGQPSHDDVIPGLHHRRFMQAVVHASSDRRACYLLAGDSTVEGGHAVGLLENAASLVRRRMIETFGPSADVIDVEAYGVGGSTWADWAAPSPRTGLMRHHWLRDPDAPLHEAVGRRNPDAVLWCLGQNDAGGFDASAVRAVLDAVATRCPKRFGLPPDMIFMTPYAPSLMAASHASGYEQEARDYVAGWIRTFAQRHGHGLIDQNRVAAMARDGFDVRTQRMVQIAGGERVVLPYAFARPASDFGAALLFEDGEADLWLRGRLIVPLSQKPGEALVIERDPSTLRIAVTIDSGTTIPSRPRALAPLDTPGGPLEVEWAVKGPHLRLTVNGFVALDVCVERHGGLFLPSIAFDGGAPPAARLLRAMAGVPLLCMPDLLDREQFGVAELDGGIAAGLQPGGGNGINHQSSLGLHRVTGRALECARFA